MHYNPYVLLAKSCIMRCTIVAYTVSHVITGRVYSLLEMTSRKLQCMDALWMDYCTPLSSSHPCEHMILV